MIYINISCHIKPSVDWLYHQRFARVDLVNIKPLVAVYMPVIVHTDQQYSV